ncbi:hypothetical protein BKA61DRAFT_597577 [Leptodontidium sp. MPI-SDFR-AT-0119]|nr:hypothetical protein BKA61DRAFT_597577 [Leptodontidium sp. MPI-SDFR-AT-0119]
MAQLWLVIQHCSYLASLASTAAWKLAITECEALARQRSLHAFWQLLTLSLVHHSWIAEQLTSAYHVMQNTSISTSHPLQRWKNT